MNSQLVQSESLPNDFDAARQSFATRRVPRAAMHQLRTGSLRPEVGDLVLARVMELGQHRSSELTTGRKASLFVGDLVILAYGNRYAPDQFEALVPLDIGPCDMVAGGGLAAREVVRHDSMSRPTSIKPLGLLADAQGEILNLHRFALPQAPAAKDVPVYVICGTSMNSGKTHTVAMLIRGLKAMGKTVAACKVTGTGSGNDLWKMHDIGASRVLDFVDAGWPSTYGTPLAELERIFTHLIDASMTPEVDAVVVEIADGLGQSETAGLLRSPVLRDRATAILFAAPDPMGAVGGERWLRAEGLPLIAVSGLMTADAEAVEEARRLLQTPVLTAGELAQGWPFAEILNRPQTLTQTLDCVA